MTSYENCNLQIKIHARKYTTQHTFALAALGSSKQYVLSIRRSSDSGEKSTAGGIMLSRYT